MADDADLRQAVIVGLQRVGLSPSEPEVTELVRQYALDKAGIERLYAVDEARYEVPALLFAPMPCPSPWPAQPLPADPTGADQPIN